MIWYARHPNRLADDVIRLNDGRPEHVIEIRRAPVAGKLTPKTMLPSHRPSPRADAQILVSSPLVAPKPIPKLVHPFSPTELFAPCVARPDERRPGGWLLMDRQDGGYGEFSYPYPSLNVLATSCNATVGAKGTDKHGEFVWILPKPRA